ncbi:LpqB family beta-propeller domain-containing protein [Falsarthrobacter nasiphocae]
MSRAGKRVTAALLVALVASGCARIPTSSPVREIPATSTGGDSDVQYRLSSPEPGAKPRDIVEGFLDAHKGSQEGFDHAREYLTTARRAVWKPATTVTLYEEYPDVKSTKDPSVFEITYRPVAEIDENGLRTSLAGAKPRTERIKIATEGGENRIDSAPDGILLSTSDARHLVDQRTLYFYSPDFAHAVPDARWFLKSPSEATSIVNALMTGPSPHLKGAVATALGDHARLANPAVVVENGTAQVDLALSYWNGLKPLQRLQLKQQLELAFASMRGVDSVQIKTDSRVVSELPSMADGFIRVSANPDVDAAQVAVVKDQLTWFSNNSIQPVAGLPSTVSYAPRMPAVSPAKKQFAFLNASGSQLLTAVPGKDVVLAVTGSALTAPSFDASGWLWTVVTPSRDAAQQVRAVPAGGESESAVTVKADWLAGYTVTGFQAARDGVRVAIVAAKDGRTHLFESAVVRGDDSVPQSLTKGLEREIGTGTYTTAKWLDDRRLVLVRLGSKSPAAPVIVGPAGVDDELGALAGITAVSVGQSPDDIYLVANGQAYYRVGSAWYNSAVYLSGLNHQG